MNSLSALSAEQLKLAGGLDGAKTSRPTGPQPDRCAPRRVARALGLGAFGLLLAQTAGEAFANGVVTAPLADYNSAQVAAAGGFVTVPFGGIIANAVYTVAAATTLELNSSFTITLPTGFVFTSQPPVAAPAATVLAPASGGVGFNSITYHITGAAVPGGDTLSVGAFSVGGATALESQFGGNSLAMTFQATGNAAPGNNDAAPVSVPVFNHAVGSLPDTITPGSGHIDVTTTPPATQFVPNGATIAGSGLVANFAINTELNDPFNASAPVLDPNGLANSLNPADTVKITVGGDFTGIASAYASTTIATCAAPAPGGAFAGTVTATSLSFNGVPINTPVQICMIPDGVNPMHQGTSPYVYTYSVASGTDFFGGLAQTTAGNFYTYSAPLPVNTVAVDPITPSTLYTAIDGAGIYKSINSSTSWTAAATQPTNLHIKAIIVKPGDSTKLFAASYGNGVFMSVDSGVHWSICANTSLTSLNLDSLAIDPSGNLYAGTDAGVFASADGCATWSAMNNGLPN